MDWMGLECDMSSPKVGIVTSSYNHFYLQELHEPQIGLLRYVLEQPYSRDMVCSILSLNKQVSTEKHHPITFIIFWDYLDTPMCSKFSF